jgi:hypothetical protein
MNCPLVTLTKVLASAGLFAALCIGAPKDASAQEVVAYPNAAYVAAAQPVYYNGVPHYWLRDRWYYRHGTGWASHRQEPRSLREYRFRARPGGVSRPQVRYSGGAHRYGRR